MEDNPYLNNYESSKNKNGILGVVVTAVVSVVTIFIIYFYFGNPFESSFSAFQRKFPEPSGTKQIVLKCNYKGENVSLNQTLHKSIYDYYRNDPEKSKATKNENYETFTASDPLDTTIKTIVLNIQKISNLKGLSSDQTIDLAICLIQAIPYDDAKAALVLSYDVGDLVSASEAKAMHGRYPYETLYENKGICTDKSYLMAAIIRELGYGSAILSFDKEQHMAIGIRVSSGYSSFGSGYSYIETTNTGYKVGQLPNINKERGFADSLDINFSEKDYKMSDSYKDSKDQRRIPEIKEGNITAPSKVVKVSDGKEYGRIVELYNRNQRIKGLIAALNTTNKEASLKRKKIEALKNELLSEEGKIDLKEEEMKRAEAVYKQNPNDENYNTYYSHYNDYKRLHDKLAVLIGQYNQAVEAYNGQVNSFNKLINEYNYLIGLD